MQSLATRCRPYRGTEQYLGKRSVVPEIALVGETIADEAELSLLHVLLDRIESFFLRDLITQKLARACRLDGDQKIIPADSLES